MNDFTAEQLINAIHSADSLEELKRMVGAPQKEIDASAKRIEELDRLFEKYEGDINAMPSHVYARYEKIMNEQDSFESNYC